MTTQQFVEELDLHLELIGRFLCEEVNWLGVIVFLMTWGIMIITFLLWTLGTKYLGFLPIVIVPGGMLSGWIANKVVEG